MKKGQKDSFLFLFHFVFDTTPEAFVLRRLYIQQQRTAFSIRSNTTRQSQQYQPFTIEHQLITNYISIPEDGEFFAEGLQGLHIEFCCGDAYRIVCD